MSELADAYAFCRRVAHRSGPNFSVGFRFLPKSKRDAVYATYAFCRFIDDVVDERPHGNVTERLTAWEEELDRCYEGRPTRRITLALADTIARYPIPKTAFAGLIAGCRQDLVQNRYESFDQLMGYSDLVATTISTMSLAIFGYRDDTAIPRGRDLATAFQLTNILRDVGDDIGRDRIYLPLDELSRFDVSEDDLKHGHVTPEFQELMRFQVQRVREHYDRAEVLLELLEPDARRCARLMGSVYYQVLNRIEACDYRVFGRRVGLTLPQKVGLVVRTYVEGSSRWVI